MTRLAQGGRIDRGRPLRFTFDGRAFTGFAGDTLASALLAQGQHLVGRSFKYHRPRGILSAGSEEPNALVELDRGGGRREPNTRATVVPLTDGLVARSQNRWPSLRYDLAALNGLASAFIPAGFYYKTFMGPGRDAWHRRWEPMIRRMAGLGRAPDAPDPDRYANRFAHCEVLVVGAGPAGIAAALAAAEGGGRVILCDEQMEMGGSLLASPAVPIDGRPAWSWLEDALAALRSNPRVTLLPRTTAFSYGLQNFVALAEVLDRPDGLRERLWQVRAEHVVLAAGAIERPIPFSGNDRPGVMLAEAARSYATRWAVLPGRQVAAVLAHDSGYRAVFDLQDAGAGISVVLDMRVAPPEAMLAAARQRGIGVLQGHGVAGTVGGVARIAGLRAALRGADGRLGAAHSQPFACDLLLMAGGWTPSVHLFSQSRGKLRWDAAADAFLPGTPRENQTSVGACNGTFDLGAALVEGHAAGGGGTKVAPRATVAPAASGMPVSELAAGTQDATKAFVDLQNDVTTRDIALAVCEGFHSIEHVKRYTTNGMATDQGKTSNMPGLAVAATVLGRSVPEVGLTTFRAPYTPTTFGTFAGRHRGQRFDPVRTAPLHDWAVAQGAVFEPVGQWQRARYFPRPGEDMETAVARECLAVRNAAGVFDASTLGKIEVVGPDAAEFLERCYANTWKKLAPGRCRYGVLLREDGFVYDDGVVGRLAEDRFHVTTTTGGAAGVLHMLEDYRQTEFTDLRVWLTSTTEHWGVIALQGPKAREVLSPLVNGLDLGAFPHMAVGECTVAGIPARLFRVSFTGEVGFEVNVPAGCAPAIWQALLEAGAPHGITPYGTEAMHMLRAEKGYIIVGQDTDGTVTPDDVGLSWLIGKAKRDFIGKRSLARPEMLRTDRRQWVGLVPRGRRSLPDEGAQLLGSTDARQAQGHVTSAYRSATLGHPIALGLLESGRARMGDTVFATSLEGAPLALEVVSPVFLDPKGERLHG
jgi:sarcosine oxidase subunit alpha